MQGKAEPEEILNKLRLEKDWHMSCIFTDSGQVFVDNGCNLRPEELK